MQATARAAASIEADNARRLEAADRAFWAAQASASAAAAASTLPPPASTGKTERRRPTTMGNRRHLAARSPRGFRATPIMAVAAFAGLAAGCNTTNLSSAGAAVAPSLSSPVEQGFAPGSCVELGPVVGRGSRGSLPSDDKLAELALNDLRNRAAALGGNVVQHGAPQVRSAGSIDSLFNSTAIVRGTAYRCAQPMAPSASASAPLAAAPTDAGAGPGRAPPTARGGSSSGRPPHKPKQPAPKRGSHETATGASRAVREAWCRWDRQLP